MTPTDSATTLKGLRKKAILSVAHQSIYGPSFYNNIVNKEPTIAYLDIIRPSLLNNDDTNFDLYQAKPQRTFPFWILFFSIPGYLFTYLYFGSTYSMKRLKLKLTKKKIQPLL